MRLAGRIRLDSAEPLAGRRTKSVARKAVGGENPVEARVRDLQSTAGNAAVGRFLQREVAKDASAAVEGGAQGAAAAAAGILTFGSQGDEVSDLQRRLNRMEAAEPRLKVDGVYGRLTQAAVTRFQQQHPPLKVDGDAGPDTRAELEKTSNDPFSVGEAHYKAGRYGQAYDEFTKSYELDKDPATLYDRAQALRLMGGRRNETIALYEEFISKVDDPAATERAKRFVAELRGPGATGDQDKDEQAVRAIDEAGEKLFRAERYAQAYDEFTKAYEITHDPALLWNSAQALRFLGGRRAEAIALYQRILVAEVPDDTKAAAKRDIADLQGPGKSGDAKKDDQATSDLFKQGQELYAAEQYAQAYDAFSKAHEISGEIEFQFNRAQCLRFLGGRRSEAIALFEEVLTKDLPDETRKAVKRYIDDLRGPAARSGSRPAAPPATPKP